MLSQRRDFFMSNPVKNCFLIETFLYENKILRTHNLFCRSCTFLIARGLENSCLLHYSEVSNKRWHHLFIMRHFSHVSPLIRNHHLLNLENFTLNFLNSLNKKDIFPLKDAYLWKTFINFHEFWLLDIY